MPAKKEAREQLLIEAAQKDPARFTELYEENFERVYAFVARRLRERADAEDVTSEVFHQALANIRRFEWRGVPFCGWLYRIAANAIADRAKRAANERGNPGGGDPPASEEALGVEQIERRAKLFRLVHTLPAEQRRVIEMRFAEEKSIREIASELQCTTGAVKQLQFRGIQKLRAEWNKPVGRQKKLSQSNG
jgi:RNA polymerase sigma-70 factor, ECF subfamily